ncbi:hypothetical protein EIN_133830 [Entamoeba invadens IP1]|uniref:Uncharacterized protein n=1 Tax=Entamoeba invadens IP1 TaxID=370355 RepID=A0A0A1U2U9_ENTIV|nr:hypothetical protein EIN_133830 [Entamoeba invadens IP1]ELP85879.1 hypothetical protein EIN_133830 [Entamoeba invadens IP1]|eukprot:XP_004185225.1 hypothetical protein EIN_133830 [Entamoeba invadens IP1]
MDLKRMALDLETVDSCYDHVENAEDKVRGLAVKNECYVHDSIIPMKKGTKKMSRCGECLDLVGPSNIQVQCTTAGTFRSRKVNEIVETNFMLINMVIVNHDLYDIVATTSDNYNDEYCEIAIRQSQCNNLPNPSLYVVDNNETHSKVQVLNMHEVTEFLIINNVQYILGLDPYFTIPHFDINIKVSAITFTNDVIHFLNVNLTKNNLITSTTKYDVSKLEDCQYDPNWNIYSTGAERETNDYFKWMFRSSDKSGKMYYEENKTEVLETENYLRFQSHDDFTKIVFVAQTPINFFEQYTLFSFTASSDKKWEYQENYVGVGNSSQEYFDSIIKCVGMPIDVINTKVNDNQYNISMKMYFNKTCSYLGNVIALDFITSENSELKVTSALLIKREDHQQSCSYDTLNCENVICTVRDATIDDGVGKWLNGCIPTCGKCRTGFECTTTGKCVESIVYNSRSRCSRLFVFLVFFCVLFI